MRRRDFFAGAASTLAWPIAARAQSSRLRRVGVLESGAGQVGFFESFQQGLEQLGWIGGRNLLIDRRSAEARLDRAQAIAKELVALRPDVILGDSTPFVGLLKQETRSIPIVFLSVSDPIGSGFVESLARPGGNLTGFLLFDGSITGKWLGMLK
jgi:putative tryptophan/tyrosine transport system substrate-binding protein